MAFGAQMIPTMAIQPGGHGLGIFQWAVKCPNWKPFVTLSLYLEDDVILFY